MDCRLTNYELPSRGQGALEHKNSKQHHKPTILLNQDGYYDTLLAFLDHSIAEKFSKPEARGQFMVAKSVEEVLLCWRTSTELPWRSANLRGSSPVGGCISLR